MSRAETTQSDRSYWIVCLLHTLSLLYLQSSHSHATGEIVREFLSIILRLQKVVDIFTAENDFSSYTQL